MKINLVLFIVCCLFHAAWAQDDIIYLNKDKLAVDSSAATYFRKIQTDASNADAFIITDYYMSGVMAMRGAYLDKVGLIRDGLFEEFYTTGAVKARGRFKYNECDGDWTFWYPNGQKMAELRYEKNDELVDKQIVNFWDSLGAAMLENGEGTFMELNTDTIPLTVSAQGEVTGGKKTGAWTGYFPGGDVRYRETYKNGELVSGTSYDEDGQEFHYTKIQVYPEPVAGMAEFYRNIRANLTYPKPARRQKIQGKVFVQFVVGKDGELTDMQVIKGIGGGCDEVAMFAIYRAGKWRPGYYRGRKVKMRMILPVTFKLG